MALSGDIFKNVGGAVGDLFSAAGDSYQAENYDEAAKLADMNAQFTKTSTEIKEYQAGRQIYKTIGGQQADVAGAGLASSGSALDILRESQQQGALTTAVLGQQGLIQEEGYKSQARSYRTMADAARMSSFGKKIGAGFKLLAAGTNFIPGGS